MIVSIERNPLIRPHSTGVSLIDWPSQSSKFDEPYKGNQDGSSPNWVESAERLDCHPFRLLQHPPTQPFFVNFQQLR